LGGVLGNAMSTITKKDLVDRIADQSSNKRVAQNPKTMEKVFVPEKRTVKFKIGRLMKQRLFGDQRNSAERPLRVVNPEPRAAGDTA
jgi:hypothetical protein